MADKYRKIEKKSQNRSQQLESVGKVLSKMNDDENNVHEFRLNQSILKTTV